MSIIWNTGSAAERFRSRAQRDAAQFNLRLNEKNKNKKKKQASNKRPRTATIKKDNKI